MPSLYITWCTHLVCFGSGTLIDSVQPFLDSSEHSSVLLCNNLRDLGIPGAAILDQLLCLWGEDIQRLFSLFVHLTLQKKESISLVCVYSYTCLNTPQ